MLQNYFTIAWRALWKSKMHSVINVFGLSLGIACCALIALYVKDELTFDQFHNNADRIFRAYAKEDYGENQKFFYTTSPFPMGPALKEHLSEVQAITRINNIRSQVRIDDQLFSESVTIVSPEFFEIFDFPSAEGERVESLEKLSSLILTKSTAKRFFGETSALGSTLALQLNDRFEEFIVQAVVQDPPVNSSIQFDMLISDSNYSRLYDERLLSSAWFNIGPETYVLLKPQVDVREVEKKLPAVFKPLLGEDFEASKYFVGLQPLTSIHLDTNFPVGIAPVSNPKYSIILSAIASLILVVGCINFITLSIGQSLKRAKEVGIRKVAGAHRQQLIFQFIGEAVFVTAMSLALGALMAIFSLPLFNELSGKQLRFSFDGFSILLCAVIVFVIGILAGSYPAFVLSAFKPISVLKGAWHPGNSKQSTRKVLVGVQLVLSIFLVSSTLLMEKQLRFLKEKNMGFDKEQLVSVPLNVNGGRLREIIPSGFAKAEQFKLKLTSVPQIVSVASSSHDFGRGTWMNVGYTDDIGVYRTFSYNAVDDDYIETMGMHIVAGRDFSDNNSSDARRAIIINEAFAKAYEWTNPIGKRLPGENFIDHEVIGVVKDFHYASLYSEVEPLVLSIDPTIVFSGIENINVDNSPTPKLLIRLRAGQISEGLDQIRSIWNTLTNGEEFFFSFVDESLAFQYRNDENLGKIVRIATILAIIIGCMGLYGLSSLAMRNRVKEISIRKVLGANERSLLVLLSKDYVYLIVISLLISVPITYWLMRDWLSSFEYRVTIGIGVFLTAGGLSLAIAMITVSYHVLQAALSQPAKTLKYE